MLHQIGVGALGPVFRTYEPTRDRLVAIKVFRLDITPEQAQSLADELSRPAEAGLFHPSIVEPIASGVEGTVAYRAEEYVAAETLDVAMRHYAPATVEKVLPFITQLAGAIDFARSAGVGHGALHPRDIFVTPEEARASGFGVVEALERVGLRAPVRRPYTAPERVAGGGWGAPADVFSLAVIAYELLTGRRPSGTGAEIGPIDASPHAAGIQAVLIQAMDEDPSRRHTSALAFASALDAASRAEPAAAPKAAVIPPPVVPVAPEEEAFDDVAAEREEDEAHTALTFDEASAEQLGAEAAPDRSFFDDEAIEDLSLERGAFDEPQRFSEDFAIAAQRLDEPAARPAPGRRPEPESEEEEDQPPPPVFAGAPPLGSYREDPLVVHDRAGLPLVPVIVTVALALLVGFAAGYALGRRMDSAVPADTVAQATPPTGAAPGETAPAKPFSEEAVTPSAAAPPTGQPAGAPPASAAEASAPKPSGEAPAATGAAVPASPKPEPPVTTPAPVATTGRLEVRSAPSGAGVTVDGVWRGRTPLTLEKLRFKEYAVRIVQPGYAAAREEVTLSAAAPSRSVSVKLQRSAATVATPRPARPVTPPASAKPEVYTGSIYVDSRPRGARVLVDGKFMGTTPVRIADMSIGSHVVRLQLADHRDWTSSTRVTAGEEARVTGSLERNR